MSPATSWPESAPAIDAIHHGDVMDILARIPDGSVDLIIADPPYNVGPNFKSAKNWRHDPQWIAWCGDWLAECKRVLRDEGSIFVYGIHHYACFVQVRLYELGMVYRRQFIWTYENNFSGYVKLPAALYEPILWFSKGEPYTYKPIREPYKSTERLKHKITKKGKIWKPHPEGRLAGDVWRFPVLAGRRFSGERVNHPTQKPLNLTDRIIRHFSDEGALILAPFAGSGTECVSALANSRHFIGIEIVAEYVELARERLKSAKMQRAG
jgi:DNA modification methylase